MDLTTMLGIVTGCLGSLKLSIVTMQSGLMKQDPSYRLREGRGWGPQKLVARFAGL